MLHMLLRLRYTIFYLLIDMVRSHADDCKAELTK
jgi:hypothetical protein